MTESFELQIDTLTLSGPVRFAPHQLKAAIEEALERLLLERGVPAALQSGALPGLPIPALSVSPSARVAEVGEEAARLIYQALCQPPSAHRASREHTRDEEKELP